MILTLCIYFSWLFAQAASHLTCYARPPSDTPFRPPLVSDCQYILAHLPRPFSALGRGPEVSHSAPFLPEANLHYASCLITIFITRGHAPPDLRNLEYEKPPDFPLSEADIIRIWDVAKRAADKVLARCIRAQSPREGSVWGRLNVIGKGPMWYAVEVLEGWNGFTPNCLASIGEGRSAIEGNGENRSADVFRDTYYEL